MLRQKNYTQSRSQALIIMIKTIQINLATQYNKKTDKLINDHYKSRFIEQKSTNYTFF